VIEIGVIMESVPDTEIVASMLSSFHTEHPDIRVVIDSMHYDTMRERTAAALAAGTCDLYILDNPWMTDFVRAGHLTPLDDRIAATPGFDWEDHPASIRASATIDGAVYGVPFYNWSPGLIYRTDLYDEAGLSPPTTFEALAASARTLTAPGRSGVAQQPLGGYNLCEEWGAYLFASGGTIQDSDGDVALDSPEARAALELYLEVNRSAPHGSVDWTFEDSLAAVAEGRAVQMLNCNWTLPRLNRPGGPAGDLAGSFALAQVPGGVPVLGVWHWGIPPSAPNPEAAWTFVSWIASADRERERVIRGGAPVRTSAMRDPEVWAGGYGQAYYLTVLEILENARQLAEGPGAEWVLIGVGEELHGAVSGERTVDDAIRKAAARAREASAG
jgi:ABC-type glycerol-3-phosphate transport system substrate-binding protein